MDTQFPIFFESTPGNYFGYTVALHKNREGALALVGAPRADITILKDQVNEPGALYKCRIFATSGQKCKEVVLDTMGNTYSHRGNVLSYRDRKDNMWLGVSLDIQQNANSNDIVICGHLWKNQIYQQHYLANGVCYTINSDLDPKSIQKHVPFVNKSMQTQFPPGLYVYAFGQVGTAATYSEDGRYLLLGAPGYKDWTGTILSYNLNSSSTNQSYVDPIIPDTPSHQEMSPEAYFGYAITSGKFYDNNEIFVAVGAPRDGNNHGRVYIFKALKDTTTNISIHQKKEGKQFGEYFGSALLGVNLNNDRFTDLLIGAPFHSSENGGDEGKVYVYISNGMGLSLVTNINGGNKPQSRFGTAIANLGDINQDGYNDVGIGAPYEDGKGAIYIYHGTSSGLNPEYTQKVLASEIKPSLSGFGIHISRGLDIDSNQYPDILVGAYDSSEAVLLRSRPIIQLFAKISFSPQQINTNVTTCEYQGAKFICVNVTTCLQYIGRHVPSNLDFTSSLSLGQQSQYSFGTPRGFFLNNNVSKSHIEHSIKSIVGIDECKTETLYVDREKDVITPIEFLYSYDLVQEKQQEFNNSFLIIDPASATSITSAISFQTGCGKADKCLSDLKVNVAITGNFQKRPMIIGKDTILEFNITVSNKEEPAYSAELLIYVPPEIPRISQDSCLTLNEQQKKTSNATLICSVGNPLTQDKTVRLKLDVKKFQLVTEQFNVQFKARTASTEIYDFDNSEDIDIKFKTVVDISITGTPFQEQIPLREDDIDTNVLISHTYFVMNHGPSPLDTLEFRLYVPSSFQSADGPKDFVTFQRSQEDDSGKTLSIAAKCNDTGLYLKPTSPEGTNTKNEVFGEKDLIVQGDNSSNSATTDFGNSSVLDISKRSLTSEVPPDEIKVSRSKKSIGGTALAKKRKDVAISCEMQGSQCTAIFCSASSFSDTRKFARITLSFLVNLTVLNEVLDPWYRMAFITKGEVFIRGVHENIQPKHHIPDKITVKTTIIHPGLPPSEEIAQWIIFVSIGVGILLLIIILIALIKIGFFKRQQKEKMKEMMTSDELKEDEPYLMADEAAYSDSEMANV